MAEIVATRSGAKVPERETITVNLGHVDLGHVDLRAAEGAYADGSDVIRPAIRNGIERHADITRRSVARRSVAFGLCPIGRPELDAARAEGRRLDIRVPGLAGIAPDVMPDLARAALADRRG